MGEPRTLPDALADAARTDNGFSFIAPGREVFRSYVDLQRNARRMAHALTVAGLEAGDLAALVVPAPEPCLTALLGASIAGLTPASLQPPATTTALDAYLELTAGILRASQARAVITTAALAPSFETLRPACPDLSRVLVADDLPSGESHLPSPPTPDDIAFVQFTSGSTSTPKGVALAHRSLSANIEAINGPAGVNIRPADVAVSWLPLYHDMGLIGMALCALYAARPCVLLTPEAFVRRPIEWLRAITRHRGTISFAPNFAFDLCVRRVKDADLADLDLSCWRVAGCGAEPIQPATLAAFADRFASVGFRASSFLPSYGLAEHVLAATFPVRDREPRIDWVSVETLTADRVAAHGEADTGAVAVISCGSPLPGHQLKIVDDQGRPQPERHIGEILLAGPSVMLGYYKRDDLSAQTIVDGWLRTGDLGYLSDGELFVCGRLKDIVIANGRKYHPQDLEWAVDAVGGVRRGRVVAFGISAHGRADRVVIVAEPNGTIGPDVLSDAIRRRIGDVFGLYVDDVAVVPGGTIGRTTSGKVQRAATKARYQRGEFQQTELRAQTSGSAR